MRYANLLLSSTYLCSFCLQYACFAYALLTAEHIAFTFMKETFLLKQQKPHSETKLTTQQ